MTTFALDLKQIDEADLGFQISFLIRSDTDAFRLLTVIRDQCETDGVLQSEVEELEQLLKLWSTEKPDTWLRDLQRLLGAIEDVLFETECEWEFAYKAQAAVDALGLAASRRWEASRIASCTEFDESRTDFS